jgi:uncharacterized membrane protein
MGRLEIIWKKIHTRRAQIRHFLFAHVQQIAAFIITHVSPVIYLRSGVKSVLVAYLGKGVKADGSKRLFRNEINGF